MRLGAPDRQVSLMRVQLTEPDRSEVFDLFMLPGKTAANPASVRRHGVPDDGDRAFYAPTGSSHDVSFDDVAITILP